MDTRTVAHHRALKLARYARQHSHRYRPPEHTSAEGAIFHHNGLEPVTVETRPDPLTRELRVVFGSAAATVAAIISYRDRLTLAAAVLGAPCPHPKVVTWTDPYITNRHSWEGTNTGIIPSTVGVDYAQDMAAQWLTIAEHIRKAEHRGHPRSGR